MAEDIVTIGIKLDTGAARRQISAFDAALKRLRKTASDTRQRIESVGKVKGTFSTVSGEVNKLADSMKKAQTASSKLNTTMKQSSASIGRTGTAIKQVSAAATTGAVAAGNMSNRVNTLSKNSKNAETSLISLGLGFRRLYLVMATITGVFGLLTMSIGRTIMDVETLRMGLNALEGSAVGGGELFQWLASEADRLGLSLQSSAHQFKLFNAATKGSTIEGAVARDIFTSFSEAIAVMGLSADDATGVFRALQQMVSKGSVNAEELRQQLGERLPSAFRLAAEAMGVTQAELNDMLKRGEVMAEDLLPKMARLMREAFGDDVVNASRTLRAEVNRLSNEWMLFVDALGQSGLTDALASVVRGLRSALEGLRENIDAVGDAFLTLASVAGGVFVTRMLMATRAIVSMEAAILGLTLVKSGIIAKLIKWGRVLGGWAGIAATAIGAVVGAMIALSGREEEIVTQTEMVADVMSDLELALGGVDNTTREGIQSSLLLAQQQLEEVRTTKLLAEQNLALAKSKLAVLEVDQQQASYEDPEWVDTGGLDEARAAVAKLGTEVSKLTIAEDYLIKRQKELENNLKRFASSAGQTVTTYEDLDKAVKTYISAQENLTELMEAGAPAEVIKKYTDNLGGLWQNLIKIPGAQELYTKRMKEALDKTKDKTKATKEQKDAYKELLNQLQPLIPLVEEYATNLGVLFKAMESGKITQNEYLELVKLLQTEFESSRDKIMGVSDELDKNKDKADPWADALTNAVERVDSAFVDLWKSAFTGFKDFADTLKNAFVQLLAELAHLAITRKIVISIVTALGGGKLVEGLATGGEGGMGFSDLLSLPTKVMDVVKGIPSFLAGNSIGTGFADTGIGAFANAGSMSNMAYLGAGALGGIGGYFLGDALFGGKGYSGAGGGLGGAGGAMLGMAMGGPIGALIGGLLGGAGGGFLGSLFGDKTDPRVGLSTRPMYEGTGGLEDNVYRESAFGIIGYRGASHDMDAAAEEWSSILDMIANLDDALAEFMSPEQIKQVQEAFADFEGTLTDLSDFDETKLGAMLAERFSIATDILDSTIGQQLNQWVQNFSGTGEEFAAGMTAWLAGMKVIDTIEFDDPAMTKLMEEFFTGLMTSVDPEQFLPAAEAFAKLAAVFDFDVMAEGARMFEEANMSAWDSLLTLKDGVWDAINTFDGTVESIQRLADATGNFKAAAAQMIAAISAIQQKISETTAGTIEQMRTSMMGDEEKANYFIDEANRLKTDLATMTDPAEIESTVAKINELVLGAFNTLPEEMRASFLAWAEPFLLDTEDLANKRLEAAKEEIGTMTTAIEGAIVSGLGKVAADFQAAANTMNQAAANIPREIDANVSVTVNNTGNTGMAYGEIGY